MRGRYNLHHHIIHQPSRLHTVFFALSVDPDRPTKTGPFVPGHIEVQALQNQITSNISTIN